MKKAMIFILAGLFLVQLLYLWWASSENSGTLDSIEKMRADRKVTMKFENVIPPPPKEDRLIADFETAEDTSGIIATNGQFSLSAPDSLSIGRSLVFDFERRRYPALEFYYLPRDWNYYKKLDISVVNPSDDTLNFILRIDDHLSDWNIESYFADKRQLSSGQQTLGFTTADIGQKVDLSDIYRIVLALERPSRSGTIYIDDLILRH